MVTLIVFLDLFVHPNQVTSLITAELHLLMPQRFAENRTQIKNRRLVRMGHYTVNWNMVKF